MFCFVSSWYSENEKWKTNETPWFRQKNAYQFDDTINQIRMFRAAKEPVQLMVLSYAPGLRMFLHRQNLYPMEAWNLYDEMQGICLQKLGLLSYQSLSWPRNLIWRYTPFMMIGFVGDKRYAQLYLGENGNLIQADYFDDREKLRQSDIYDDRGFCSSRIYYETDGNRRQEFLNEDGISQFVEEKETGTVTVLPAARKRFRRTSYASMDLLVEEMLQKRFLSLDPDTVVVVAANVVHNQLILRTRKGQTIGFSYFENRFPLDDTDALQEDLKKAAFAVTDTEHSAKVLREKAGTELSIYDISPFDTRLSLGKSQRIRELKVFMPLDGLEGFLLETAMQQVFSYMEKNDRVILLAATRHAGEEARQELAGKLQELLDKDGMTDHLAIAGKDASDPPQENGKTDSGSGRIQVVSYQTETDLIEKLYDVRLILDVRDQPDLYLQIAGISAGIPQVNYRYTRYVQHQKDGYIIQNIHYITGALEYYLSELAHWNEALVYCVREIEQYTGGSLVQQWKEAVEKDAE